MANLHDPDHPGFVIDGIYHPVVALPEPVSIGPGQLLTAEGARGLGQHFYFGDQPGADSFGHSFQLFDGRRLDPEVIAFHAVSGR